MAKNKQKENKNKLNINIPKANNEIPLHGSVSVRVVYKENPNEHGENDFVRIMPMYEAKRIAREMELDLVEVSPDANPPVVKICDLSKLIYELKKQAKAKSKNNSHTELKEISLSVTISQHDLEIKAKKAKEFIADGHKVKVVLLLRGRELARREENKKSLYTFIMLMDDTAVLESLPKDEGNRAIVIMKPKK